MVFSDTKYIVLADMIFEQKLISENYPLKEDVSEKMEKKEIGWQRRKAIDPKETIHIEDIGACVTISKGYEEHSRHSGTSSEAIF